MLLILVLLLSFILTPQASGQTCPPATPLGSGTTYQIPSGTSWTTIQNTVNSLNPGDNLLFQRGAVFNTTAQLLITRDGTAANKILIGAYGTGAAPIIDGTGAATSVFYGIHFDGANHVIWDGIDLRNMRHGQAVTIENNSNFITFRRSKLDGSRLACIKIAQNSDDVTIEYNQINNCGDGGSYGESIYVSTDPTNLPAGETDIVLRPIIRYNTIINNRSELIEFKAGVRDGVVEGNHLQGGNQGLLISHPSSDRAGHTYQNSHVIKWNLVRDQTGSSSVYGLAIRSGATIFENVVANVGGTSRPGIWIHDISGSGQTIVAHHNTVYNASGAAFSDGGGANTTFQSNNLGWASGSGNFASNPLFVNPSTFDFRLQSGSPANGFGAYDIGEALRVAGHTACESGGEPELPPGTEIVADYNWDNVLTDASVADNDCIASGLTFGTPSPTQGTWFAAFDTSTDAIVCPTVGIHPTQGTVRTLAYVSSCTGQTTGAPGYLLGHSSTGVTGTAVTPEDRWQIYVYASGGGCGLGFGWGDNHLTLVDTAVLTPATWYYIAATWASGTLRTYLETLDGDTVALLATGVYSGLAEKGPNYAWGNRGTLNSQGFLGRLKDSRVWNRVLSLAELQADFTVVTGGGTTDPADVSLSAWRVVRADSPQDAHHFLGELNTAVTIPSPSCVDVRLRVTSTGGDITDLSVVPTWRQDGTGPYGPLGDSDEGTLRMGQNLLVLNRTATTNQLGTTSFVAGSYLNSNPPQAFLPISLTDGQSTELVTTVCPDPGLTAPTYFELCLAEPNGAALSCPTPVRLNIGSGVAQFKG